MCLPPLHMYVCVRVRARQACRAHNCCSGLGRLAAQAEPKTPSHLLIKRNRTVLGRIQLETVRFLMMRWWSRHATIIVDLYPHEPGRAPSRCLSHRLEAQLPSLAPSRPPTPHGGCRPSLRAYTYAGPTPHAAVRPPRPICGELSPPQTPQRLHHRRRRHRREARCPMAASDSMVSPRAPCGV